jgi:hypothetical protein
LSNFKDLCHLLLPFVHLKLSKVLTTDTFYAHLSRITPHNHSLSLGFKLALVSLNLMILKRIQMKNLTILSNLLLLLFVGCAKSKSLPATDHGSISAIENKSFFTQVGEVHPYDENNLYASKMKECIYADEYEKSCKISDLPFLGSEDKTITIEMIMKRTLVSHDFLADTFRQTLKLVKPEILQMFGSVTAIVISDQINPSFYYPLTGTMYLSGRYFWRDYDEYQLLNQVKDSREDSGHPLQFTYDSDYINLITKKSFNTRADQSAQSYAEIAIRISRLLMHELTHANDYFPQDFYADKKLDANQTVVDAALKRLEANLLISQRLPTKVSSSKLAHLGQILYQGEDALPEDSLITATEVFNEFKNDIASDLYAYSTDNEDLAMLSEEALMLYYHDYQRYTVFLKLPGANIAIPEDYDYPIMGGLMGRVHNSKVKPRVLFAEEAIFGKVFADKLKIKLDGRKEDEIPAGASWDSLYY